MTAQQPSPLAYVLDQLKGFDEYQALNLLVDPDGTRGLFGMLRRAEGLAA